MNHSEFFKKYGLEIDTKDGLELQIRGFSSLPGNDKTAVIQYARQNKKAILFEIIWDKAWTLAEWVDNPTGAPLEERQAMVPEIERWSRRIDELMAAPPTQPTSKAKACLHGKWCPRLSVKDDRQVCMKSGQPVFDMNSCPAGLWWGPQAEPNSKD